MGVKVPRERLRESMLRVDLIHGFIRQLPAVEKRTYGVPNANSLGHIDGLHCLWGTGSSAERPRPWGPCVLGHGPWSQIFSTIWAGRQMTVWRRSSSVRESRAQQISWLLLGK